MRYVFLACLFLCGCDDEALLYADGSEWENPMPLSPGRIIPRDLNAREFAIWAAQQTVSNVRDAVEFTPDTVGDFSTDPTEFWYRIIEHRDRTREAEVWLVDQGISDGTGFFFTIPEAIWPSVNRDAVIIAYDNGSACLAQAEISAAGQITIGISNVSGTVVRFSTTGWTNSGNKGLGQNIIRYQL
jgi:hypothetical protein